MKEKREDKGICWVTVSPLQVQCGESAVCIRLQAGLKQKSLDAIALIRGADGEVSKDGNHICIVHWVSQALAVVPGTKPAFVKAIGRVKSPVT